MAKANTKSARLLRKRMPVQAVLGLNQPAGTPAAPLNPLIGHNPRETMDRVSAVLAFVCRSAELRLEVNSLKGLGASLDDFRDDELNGLTLIYQALIRALDDRGPGRL